MPGRRPDASILYWSADGTRRASVSSSSSSEAGRSGGARFRSITTQCFLITYSGHCQSGEASLSNSMSAADALRWARMAGGAEHGGDDEHRRQQHVHEAVSYTHLTLPTNREG